MDKRSSKRSRKANQLTMGNVDQATGGDEPVVAANGGKNPAAVALGRLGGRKGGKARAAALSKKERSEIARKAAQARWAKQKKVDS